MKYFDLLPKIEYSNKSVRNLFKKYDLATELDGSYLQRYQISEYQTLEKISYELYATTDYWWLLAIVNNIKDIIFDLPLPTDVMVSIAKTEASEYPTEQYLEKYVEIYDKLESDNNDKRFINVINPQYMSQVLTLILESIKEEKTEAIRLESKKKTITTLEAFEDYYNKATADEQIDEAEQVVLQYLIDSNYIQYSTVIAAYDSSVTGYNELVTAWNDLNSAWVNLKSEWNDGYKQNVYKNALETYASCYATFQENVNSYNIEQAKNDILTGSNGAIIDLSQHEIGGTPFDEYVFDSDGIVVWSGLDEEKDGLITNEPNLSVDDLYAATDTLKEYRFNSAGEWVELLNADYAQALADVDGKRTIFSSKPTVYKQNDILIPSVNFTEDGVDFIAKELYIALNDNTVWSTSDWEKATIYTDDTAVENIINGATDIGTAIANGQALSIVEQNAQEATDAVTAMQSDSILSVAEKTVWRREWEEILSSYDSALQYASLYALVETDEYNNMLSAKDSLEQFLTTAGVWSDPENDYNLGDNSLVELTTYYYSALSALTLKINSTLENQEGALESILNQAETLDQSLITKNNANNALSAVIDMASDSVLSVAEKATWRTEWEGIQKNYDGVLNSAKSLELQLESEYTSCVSYFSILYYYLRDDCGVWTEKDKSVEIDGEELISNVQNYYAALQNLVNLVISESSIKAEESAKGYADYLKNESDSSLSSFIVATYTPKIAELEGLIDNTITTWFYAYAPSLNNAPASDWTDNDIKNAHLGDIFYDTSTGYGYRFMYLDSTYSWLQISDSAVAEALAAAAAAQDTADGKRRVFVDTPTVPYDVGDLWAQGSGGDLCICKTAKTSEESYSTSDWELASRYTDDSSLDAFVDEVYQVAISDIYDQIDGKVVSWFQDTEPSWDAGDNNKHVNDMWFKPTDQELYYFNSSYAWERVVDSSAVEAYTLASEAQDTADGKRRVFVDTPTVPYDVGDLWDTGTTSGIKRCIIARTSEETYLASDWTIIADITSDNTANDTMNVNGVAATTVLSNIATAQATADGKVVTFYQDETPIAEGIGDLWVDTNDGNKLYRWNGLEWVSVQDLDIQSALSDAAAAQATADGKIVTFYEDTAPIAGMSEGDLWFDTDDENKIYRYDGSSWVSAADSRIAQAIADAAIALETANNRIQSFYQDDEPTVGMTEGDLWFDTNDDYKVYTYNGSSWIVFQNTALSEALNAAVDAQATADGKVTTFVQADSPIAEGIGDLWFDTDNDYQMYRWDGSTWGNISDSRISDALSTASTAQATADGKIQSFYQTSAPTSGMSVGDFWVDTDSGNRLYRYNGSSWVDVQDDAITVAQLDAATAIASASTAQATADGKITTYFSASIPLEPENGDLWYSDSTKILKRWDESELSWVIVSNAYDDTSYLTDGAELGLTANWSFIVDDDGSLAELENKAQNAVDSVSAMQSDSILAASEKATWRVNWESMMALYDSTIQYANTNNLDALDGYGILVDAKTDLETFLTTAGVWSDPENDYVLGDNSLIEYTSGYYAALQNLLSSIEDAVTMNEESLENFLNLADALEDKYSINNVVNNFNSRNDRISTIPAKPYVSNDGTAMDVSYNSDGTANLTFKWTYSGTGDAYNIDGFLVFLLPSASGETRLIEHEYNTNSLISQFEVKFDVNQFSILSVSAGRYYTFAVCAYRIVDEDIEESGILKSNIVQTSYTQENPFFVTVNVPAPSNIRINIQ